MGEGEQTTWLPAAGEQVRIHTQDPGKVPEAAALEWRALRREEGAMRKTYQSLRGKHYLKRKNLVLHCGTRPSLFRFWDIRLADQ